MTRPDFVKLHLEPDIMCELHSCALNAESIIGLNDDFSMRPMEYEQIHMTVVFLGNALKGMQKEDRNSVGRLIESFHHENTVLELDHYELFGREKNLLVACFKAPQGFINDVIHHKSLYEKYGAKKENYFTPHITLGKIHRNSDKEINLDALPIPEIRIHVDRLVMA